MTNQHLQTTFPYDTLIKDGLPSPAFEQFLRALHLRTGNKQGINVQDVQETAQDALQTATSAQSLVDICLLTLLNLDQNLQNSNLSLQGLLSSTLNNQALVMALLSEVNSNISSLNTSLSAEIAELKKEIAELKKEIAELKG